ncbi:MAG: c-type cytochrome, partial [Acidobacteria bacterium]|nr:c-type cytochrome [Acidobacteriota bacterium]
MILRILLLAGALASAQDAQTLFQKHCGVCHGSGQGTERGPNLMNNRTVLGATRAQTLALIRDGVPARGMPPFPLPAAELELLTDLVRSLSAPAADAQPRGDARAGRSQFESAGCLNCHMVHGRGKLNGPDLSNLGREKTLAEIEEAVRTPSATIKTGYSHATVRTKAGQTIRGFLRNQSRYNLQLQDSAGRFHLLNQNEVQTLTVNPRSIMPAPAGDPANLIAYLATLRATAESFRLQAETGPAFAQLANPKPGDWASYHGLLSGNRHSPLNQITPANVGRLALQWVFPVNHNVLEVTPLVVDGVMYVSGPNQVFAIDARAGRTIWHYQRPRSPETRGDPAKGTNRGVAILGDQVFLVTDNAHLLSIHRVSGQLLWERVITEGVTDTKNLGNTAAPLVVNGLVVAGVSGGDLGARGFLDAYDAATGERVWRFWTVPAPGEPLSETWQGTALPQFGGGGATWMTGTFDPETQTVFWGTGN